MVTIGRDGPTQAQAQRAMTLLHALQGIQPVFDNPWLQAIWKTSDTIIWPESFSATSPDEAQIPIYPDLEYPINDSQKTAVNGMLSSSPDSRVLLIQGPPGTGKTTVIATYVLSAIAAGQKGIWLMAQSNVAVKNIAEKLKNIGFENWKLIVAPEFQVDWYGIIIFVAIHMLTPSVRHEHLYKMISRNVIKSDDLQSPRSVHRLLGDAQVILCTLSTVSSLRLRDKGVTKCVPVTSLIIDEASQIDIGDYVPALNLFKSSIRKLCFIGDDKQCEWSHLC